MNLKRVASINLMRRLLAIYKQPCFLLRREFKSLNKLSHNKSNHVPFYTAVGRAISFAFPFAFILTAYSMDAPGTFIRSVFGFREIQDKVDEKLGRRKKKERWIDTEVEV